MATQAQQNALLTFLVGTFDAAPTVEIFADLEASLDAGATNAQLAEAIVASAQFQSVFATTEAFVEGFGASLVGDYVSAEVLAAANSIVEGRIAAGESVAEVITYALNALSSVDVANETWGAAAQALTNKTTVAQYFLDNVSGSGYSTVAEMQAILANVTNEASTVTAAQAAIDTAAFTLTAGLETLDAANEALSDVLQGALSNSDVEDELLVDPADATDAEIDTAIDAAQVTLQTAVEGIVAAADYSAQSATLVAAHIADEQASLATALETAVEDQADAATAIADVDGLAEAIAAYESAVDAEEVTELAELDAEAEVTAKDTQFTNANGSYTVGGYTDNVAEATDDSTSDVLFTQNNAGDYVVYTAVASEEDYAGLTALVAALNDEAVKEYQDGLADAALTTAIRTADYIDSADDFVAMADVVDAFVFTTPASDDYATAQEMDIEVELMTDKIEALDALADANLETNYATAIGNLKTAITNATDVEADIKAAVQTAFEAGYLTAEDKAAIDVAAATSSAAANTAVDANNWTARQTTLDDAITALDTAEAAEAASLLDTDDIGALYSAKADADDAAETAQDDIDALEEALSDLAAVDAIVADVEAAEDVIADAEQAFEDAGFTAPVTLAGGIELSTSENDLFVAGSTDTEVRSMGILGEDKLYVGTGLTYNSAVLGTDEGEVELADAGDDSVLEFFLEETATAVLVHIEEKAFASSTTDFDADVTTITLTGVALEDITVDGGFITVA